jgi:hypothetical protein
MYSVRTFLVFMDAWALGFALEESALVRLELVELIVLSSALRIVRVVIKMAA